MADSKELHAGALEALPIGAVKTFTSGRREIGVLRLKDGSVHAFRNHCPHKGAPMCAGKLTGTMLPSAPGTLEYGLDGLVLRCPWHGYEFDVRTGRRPFTDSAMSMRVYPVAIRDGEVYVDLSPRKSSNGAKS
ncbi:MAG: Rieske (2Fe-2S) protein [Hyphomicrobiaceae bacterium]|nr:Rieske (2Fe-2S) protein [Hyphomicrobiaceae bacterium]